MLIISKEAAIRQANMAKIPKYLKFFVPENANQNKSGCNLRFTAAAGLVFVCDKAVASFI